MLLTNIYSDIDDITKLITKYVMIAQSGSSADIALAVFIVVLVSQSVLGHNKDYSGLCFGAANEIM